MQQLWIWSVLVSLTRGKLTLYNSGKLYLIADKIQDDLTSNILKRKDLNSFKELNTDWAMHNIFVASYGGSDQGFDSDATKIMVDGSVHDKRGIGFRIVTYFKGALNTSEIFNLHRESSEGTRMAKHLADIEYGSLVLAAIHDEATLNGYNENVKKSLRFVGGENLEISYRGSYCLIGMKLPKGGTKISEVLRDNGKGPSVCKFDELIRFN